MSGSNNFIREEQKTSLYLHEKSRFLWLENLWLFSSTVFYTGSSQPLSEDRQCTIQHDWKRQLQPKQTIHPKVLSHTIWHFSIVCIVVFRMTVAKLLRVQIQSNGTCFCHASCTRIQVLGNLFTQCLMFVILVLWCKFMCQSFVLLDHFPLISWTPYRFIGLQLLLFLSSIARGNPRHIDTHSKSNNYYSFMIKPTSNLSNILFPGVKSN